MSSISILNLTQSFRITHDISCTTKSFNSCRHFKAPTIIKNWLLEIAFQYFFCIPDTSLVAKQQHAG